MHIVHPLTSRLLRDLVEGSDFLLSVRCTGELTTTPPTYPDAGSDLGVVSRRPSTTSGVIWSGVSPKDSVTPGETRCGPLYPGVQTIEIQWGPVASTAGRRWQHMMHSMRCWPSSRRLAVQPDGRGCLEGGKRTMREAEAYLINLTELRVLPRRLNTVVPMPTFPEEPDSS